VATEELLEDRNPEGCDDAYDRGLADGRQGLPSQLEFLDLDRLQAQFYDDGYSDGTNFVRDPNFHNARISRSSPGLVHLQRLGSKWMTVYAAERKLFAAAILAQGKTLYGVSGCGDRHVESHFAQRHTKTTDVQIDKSDLRLITDPQMASDFFEFLVHQRGDFVM
jgi:hypothetical protein